MIWRQGKGLVAVTLTVCGSCMNASEDPVVLAEPNRVDVGMLPTTVYISGEHLLSAVHLSVDDRRPVKVQGAQVRIGNVVLEQTLVKSRNEITAVVPAALAPGVYDVEVLLGYGRKVTVEQGFEVEGEVPTPSSEPAVNPASTGSEGGPDQTAGVAPLLPCNAGTFGAPEPIWSTVEGPDYGPALSADRLTLLFSRVAPEGENLYWAERATLDSRFGTPTRFEEFAVGNNSTAALSADKLRIIFMSDRSGSRDLWTAARGEPGFSFGSLGPMIELNSQADESRPWLSPDELTIYFESNRDGATGYDIWQASRASIAADFGAPTKLAGISTPLIEGSPSFTPDNLTLYYLTDALATTGRRSLFQAQRDASDENFGGGLLIAALADYEMNGYVTLSADGRELVFSAPGTQIQQLWRSLIVCE